MRQDAVAQMIRQDAVAELEDHKPGIQVSLNVTGGGAFCMNCQRPLRSENVRLLVTPPHELAEEPEYIEERRIVVMICKACDNQVLSFETRLHFS